ncbi:MAG: SpoIID/LytB domain-containing protein [Chloroflexi bacterium]|nr:SpoIID/LytB domain-containing protein [Chloroflexota bacterium]
MSGPTVILADSTERRCREEVALPPPEAVIEADIAAQDSHDWSTFLCLRTAQAGPPESRSNHAFLGGGKGLPRPVLQDIVSARLVAAQPLPLHVAAGLTRMDRYLALYGQARAYVVAIDYQLEEQSQQFYNGVNYRLYVLAPEEGQWVIVEASEVPLHRVVEAGYGFGTLEEGKALRLQADAADHQPPSTITVARTDPVTGEVVEILPPVDFTSYVENVLPNEWIAWWAYHGAWQALHAGALACKMYGWYRVYYAKYPGQGYDVRDDSWDQVYEHGSEHPWTNQAVEVVQGLGIERADGRLFETQHWAGAYGPEGQSSGKMSQWGTRYWADQGETYDFMVYYYYDYSPNSGLQPAAFFTYTLTVTPTSTATGTATFAPTATATVTGTLTATPTSTPTVTVTATPADAPTPTSTASATATVTPASTPSATPLATPTATVTPTSTPSATPLATPTATPTPTQVSYSSYLPLIVRGVR